MRLGVLGPLAVWDDEGQPVQVPETKVRALLADLLAHDGGPVSADRLIHDLWGDSLPGNPAGALQAKVSQLRRVIGRERLVRQPPGYRLRLDAADEVDADRFGGLVAEARTVTDPRARAALLTEALGLWRGPAYADFADEEFVRAARECLAEQRLAVLEEQAEARLAAGDHLLLAGELAALVAQHPLRERLRAVQMQALYRAGHQGEALASYEDLRTRLAGELGACPGPALSTLHQAMLRQDPGLAAAAPPPADAAPALPSPVRPEAGPADPGPDPDPAPAPPAGLPVPLTALIGREQALGRLARLLARQRLVTLTGPGGVGKTRLAVAAAQDIASGGTAARLPDGAWFVEFAGVRSATPDDLAEIVAAALGIRHDAPSAPPATGTGAASAVRRLTAALRDRRTLLVLDNCEHVVAAAAELVALLLRGAPQLRVLTTSQEPLALAGETVFLVEPLHTPDAVRLFTERAAACAPGFRLGADEPEGTPHGAGSDHAAVAEICRRLDGIPLALELAATRVRALGVRELAARLGDRFRVLTSGQRGAPARQQTLRAMIDWSWELLDAPERLVLGRLAVHSDGCDLAAAEAVCAGEGVAGGAVLDLVTRLVEKSLVVVADGPTGPRYRLLESVAAYSVERLRETADETAARERHLRHYLALAERAERRLRGPHQRDWLARLDTEAGNLRAALDEAVRRAAAGRSTEAVRLATALSWWWLLRGRITEARRSLAAVLAATAGDTDPELALLHGAFVLLTGERTVIGTTDAVPDPVRRARALWLTAYGMFSVGDLDGSRAWNTRALDHFEAADEPWGIAAALGLRAVLALVRGDLDGLARDGQRSRALFRDLGDRWGELQTVSPLAALAEIKGEYAQAAHRQHEGLQMARELCLEAEVSARLSGLGRLALLERNFDRARELHEQARRIAVEQGYKYGEIHADMGLALGARRAGDVDGAEAHLLRIRDQHACVSSPAGDHLLHAELGFIAELRGDAAQAAAHHLRGLEIARTLDEPRARALSLEGLAGTATLYGHRPGAACAALLLGAAHAARRSVGAPLPPAERGDVDRVTAAAQAVMGVRAFQESFERGAWLSPDEAERHACTTLDGLTDQAA
ncbi:BTAD domain-containing putative transcriptional regulator [Streptomyces naphthomycinicus]|uniref:BTAD domain-containing putative transcriptional regulator n=1 Tax=Streptomyces naphthomycinicus TaxID=2872625 RepID=UPI001CEDCF60|nr:BTAD domain-containing putative transcriptional regulator [Streptomyces sp. TML10]